MSEQQPDKKGLNERIDDLTKKLDILVDEKKFKVKSFKLRWGIKMKLRGIAKKNKLLIFLLQRNRAIKPIIAKVENGFVMVDGVPREVAPDFIFLWEGKTPSIILPEWDLRPIGTVDYYEAQLSEDRNASAAKTLINMLESKEFNAEKKAMGSIIWWILGLVTVAVVLYLLFGGSL